MCLSSNLLDRKLKFRTPPTTCTQSGSRLTDSFLCARTFMMHGTDFHHSLPPEPAAHPNRSLCLPHPLSRRASHTRLIWKASTLATPGTKVASILLHNRTTSRPRWWWFHLLCSGRLLIRPLAPTDSGGSGLNWLKENLPSAASTLSEVQEGHCTSCFSPTATKTVKYPHGWV